MFHSIPPLGISSQSATSGAATAPLRRPGLLLRAARAAEHDYRRARHLPQILRLPAAPAHAEALALLISLEAAQEEARRENAPGYSVLRHVELLIALRAELKADLKAGLKAGDGAANRAALRAPASPPRSGDRSRR